MRLRDILQKKEAIRTELLAIGVAHPDGDLPPDVATRADELEEEAGRLNSAERRQAIIDDLDRRAQGQPLDGSGGRDSFEREAAQVNVLHVIRAQLGGTDADSGRARAVSEEVAKRSGRQPNGLFFDMRMSGARRPPEQRVFTTTLPAGGPGGALIQTDVLGGSFIDILRAKTIVRSLGATVLGGLVGNVSIPRLKASATATWVAENSPISASDPQTDAVPGSPKHVGGIVEISRNMALQPSLDVAVMVENDLAQIIARALDSAALVGGGTNQPAGLLSAGSGITIVPLGAAGAAPTWNSIVALITAVDTANALNGSLAFAGNAKVTSVLRRTLRTTTDTASSFIMGDVLNSLMGYPYASSQLVPSNGTKGAGTNLSALIFGAFENLCLLFWSELDILVNPFESTAYSKGNIQIRAMATADVAIKQPLAFAAITDMVTT